MDDFHFPERSRVRLKDGINPEFYNGLAKVGNVGVITGHRRDKLGFPEIFIKWDQEHWAYNQQSDCWTYENHFELVEVPKVNDKEKREILAQAASAFADQMAKVIGLPETSQNASTESVPENMADPRLVNSSYEDPPYANREERYAAQRDRAIELLRQEGTESFVVTTIRRRSHPDALEGELLSSAAHDSLSPEAELANGAQLASLAAQFHEGAVILQLYTLADRKHGDDGKIE